MNSFLQDWNIECDIPMGPNHELMELLYCDGQVVAQSQLSRQLSPPNRPGSIKGLQKQQFDDILGSDTTTTWIDYPSQDSFDEFSSDFLMESAFPITQHPMQSDKTTTIKQQQPIKPPMPSPKTQLFADSSLNFEKVANFAHFSRNGSSHCSSSNNGDYGSQFFGMYNKEVPKMVEERKEERVEQTLTSSSGRSGSSFGGTNKNSVCTESLKRKCRDVEDSECQSETAEQESGGGKKSGSGSTRKSRAAEVHNISERRRRDRINKKMRALQELIPHCNKTDKASMLDEAIEYLKSLQMQLQVMWMGGRMGPMMFPGMHHYMASTPNPNTVQNPILNPVNLQNQMQNHSFPEQFSRYMGQMQPTTQVPMNMFGFDPQAAHPGRINTIPSTTMAHSAGATSSINALGNKMEKSIPTKPTVKVELSCKLPSRHLAGTVTYEAGHIRGWIDEND